VRKKVRESKYIKTIQTRKERNKEVDGGKRCKEKEATKPEE
jgi:hypothetical protein